MNEIPKFSEFLNESSGNKLFTREEVIKILNKFRYEAHVTGSNNPNLSQAALDNFIKKNL